VSSHCRLALRATPAAFAAERQRARAGWTSASQIAIRNGPSDRATSDALE
jgi:hypothetical protein